MNKQQRQQAIDLATTAMAIVFDADYSNRTLNERGYALRDTITVERMQELARIPVPCGECNGTGRYPECNFVCEWCGGTGEAVQP